MPRSPVTPELSKPVRLFVVLLAFGVCTLPVFLGCLNHDEAWYLLVAERLLEGKQLYRDHFDTNPPLIVWLNLPPVLLARALGISQILALRLLVLALVAISISLIGLILGRSWPDRSVARLVLVLLSLFVLVPVVGYEFAQREHLMMMMALPYLWMATARASRSQFAGVLPWLVGLLAGVGLAIKPHFGLLWLAVEGTLVVRRGWKIAFRPEGLAIAGVFLVYILMILKITPDYLPWIRRITSVYYGAGGASFATLATEPGTILTGMAVIGFLALRPEGTGRRGLEVLLAADLALLVIAMIQVKGFAYQFYPASALAMLLIGGLLVEFSPSPADRARIVLMLRVVAALLILSVVANRVKESIGWHGRPGDSDTPLGRTTRVSKEHAKGGSVFVFSAAGAAGFPMVIYSGVGWASRHPALLFLPGCYPRSSQTDQTIAIHSPEQMGEGERFLFDGIIDQLLTDQPTLLFVDDSEIKPAFEDRRFDYLAYYAQDPRFADFLANYEPFTRVDQFRVYRKKSGNDR
jgi:hypothetical protein